MLTRKQLSTLRQTKTAAPNRLKKAIELAGVTQEIVAEGINASQSHVTEIANGNYSKLPLETARALAVFFGCSIEDLFPAREAVAS